MENDKIEDIRTPKALNRLAQNFAWMFMSAISLRTPKFTTIPSGGVPANGRNITLVCFLVFVTHMFARVPRLNRRTDFCAV